MGISASDLDNIIELGERGFRPHRIATIGRLSLFLHPVHLRRLRKLYPDKAAIAAYQWAEPCEAVLKAVTGAAEIISIDASDYEGATHIHDMNVPLADNPEMTGAFDLVIDGGSLEHVFNFPVAVSNLAALCCVGGYILSANPANNMCGHGFYQFTPELMYRIYSAQNGFELKHVLLTEYSTFNVERERRPRSYRVKDPAELGHRMLIRNRRPVLISVMARKISPEPIKPSRVQQSDYASAWSKNRSACVAAIPPPRRSLTIA